MPREPILPRSSATTAASSPSMARRRRGVDWNSAESQELRFAQLARAVRDEPAPFSLNDYGCGYGALAGYLDSAGARHVATRATTFRATMLEHARQRYAGPERRSVPSAGTELEPADYAVASGIFNVRLDCRRRRGARTCSSTLDGWSRASAAGFAFNMLTSLLRRRPDAAAISTTPIRASSSTLQAAVLAATSRSCTTTGSGSSR